MMQRKTKHILALSIGILCLVVLTAGASALITHEVTKDEKPAPVQKIAKKSEKIQWNDSKAQPAPQPAPQRVAANTCDDANIVGYGLGGIAGGLIGNQFGDGDGKKVATVGGAAVGALAGGQYIPTRNVLCPK